MAMIAAAAVALSHPTACTITVTAAASLESVGVPGVCTQQGKGQSVRGAHVVPLVPKHALSDTAVLTIMIGKSGKRGPGAEVGTAESPTAPDKRRGNGRTEGAGFGTPIRWRRGVLLFYLSSRPPTHLPANPLPSPVSCSTDTFLV